MGFSGIGPANEPARKRNRGLTQRLAGHRTGRRGRMRHDGNFCHRHVASRRQSCPRTQARLHPIQRSAYRSRPNASRLVGRLIEMAIQPISPRGHHRPRRLMRRIDRSASHINPYLFAVAIGLVVLYVTCLGALISKVASHSYESLRGELRRRQPRAKPSRSKPRGIAVDASGRAAKPPR